MEDDPKGLAVSKHLNKGNRKPCELDGVVRASSKAGFPHFGIIDTEEVSTLATSEVLWCVWNILPVGGIAWLMFTCPPDL